MFCVQWDSLPSPPSTPFLSAPLRSETFQGRSMNEAEVILEVLVYVGIPFKNVHGSGN